MNLIEQEIIEKLESVIRTEYLESASFQFVSNKSSYNSIMINAQSSVYRSNYDIKPLFCRIKTEGKTQYVSFNELQTKHIDGVFEYSKIKSDPFLRISIDEFIDKLNTSDKAKLAVNTIFLAVFSFSAFGCCGRYKECSKKGKCIHPDLIYASACQYKKNLDEGKVFY